MREFKDIDEELGGGGARPPGSIHPTVYQWRDATEIPPRRFLYGKHRIRGFLSLTVSPGGLGKSSLLTVENLSMVTGKPLLGIAPPHPLSVWSWNGEDPGDENERRLQAACLHYGITRDDLGGRLMMDSGRNVPINIATASGKGFEIAKPVTDSLVEAIRTSGADVFIVDPFITTHSVGENETTAINAVVAEWRRIADLTGTSIELVHHVSKAAALDGDSFGIYGSRGAGALIDGVRSARYLSRMSKDEADRFGIEDPELYFRVQMGKANLAPPGKADWRRMIGIPLHNGRDFWPEGDVVGVCTAWVPPDAFDGLTIDDLDRVQQAIAACEEAPKANERSSDWAGCLVAETLDLDIGRALKKNERNAAQNRARAKVRALLSGWLSSGALVVEEQHSNRDGRTVKVIAVGDPAHDRGAV